MLRSLLHREGLRYRVDFPVQCPGRRARPDVAFTKHRLAVFVDGCFWHGCREHKKVPRTNAAYWAEKISKNQERDQATDEALVAAGWSVLRVWEHEDPVAVCKTLMEMIDS